MLVKAAEILLFVLLFRCRNGVYAGQVPFRALKGFAGDTDILNGNGWDLDAGLPANSTDNLVFDTVSSLLQHWPNTRYRNGHTLVPGTIPPGTLLYHGTSTPEIPKIPEWLATDPEHSFLFCRQLQNQNEVPDPDASAKGCWHLTLVATRPLKVLYFDGSSAAKMYGGPMDSQDVLLWGEVKPEWTFAERKRIVELCEWGRGLGVDGFVRMEMDFEIMLCDFTVGVEVSSFLNLATTQYARRPPLPSPSNRTTSSSAPSSTTSPSTPSQSSFKTPPSFNTTLSFTATSSIHPNPPLPFTPAVPFLTSVLQSGSWHNHFPGDPRITLDLTRLVSFYDTSLVASLVPLREGKERWEHRLEGIAREDVRGVMRKLEGGLIEGNGNGKGSGVDWKNLIRVVTLRYSERLELVRHFATANADVNATTALENAHNVQAQLRIMLTPYILASVAPPPSSPPKNNNHTWAAPVYAHCATAHTSSLSSSSLRKRMTYSEQLVLRAVRGTEREICRVVVRMWAEGVMRGVDPVIRARGGGDRVRAHGDGDGDGKQRNEARELLQRWRGEVDVLMGWLDWSVWVKCRPACGFEEMCYLPTWPFFRPPGRRGDGDNEDEDDWIVPKPKCLRRVEPYEAP